jgi:hypothetical protein
VAAILNLGRLLDSVAGCCTGLDHEKLLLDLIVELPETQGPLGGFCGQLAVILRRKLQRCFVDVMFDRPMAKDRLDRDGNRLLHNLPHAFVGMSNAELVKISNFKNGNKTFQNEVVLPRFDHEAFALIIY